MESFVLFFWLSATIVMNPTKKIPVVFSSTDINRLSIKNGRIKNVFGADVFQVEKDEETGQIFLHAKEDVTLPDSMSMAFVTDDGVTQDFLVSFHEGTSVPVIFEEGKPKLSLRRSAKQFLYDILSNKTNQYVRQDSGSSEEFEWGRAQFKYKFLSSHFIAEVFEVTGKKKCCTYKLRHPLFLKPGSCAIYLSDKILKKNHPVILVVLRKR